MRLDIVPENPLESVALWSGLLPSSVVKAVWGFTLARTLLSAVELGVFDALADGPRTSAELASRLRCDPEGMRTLLAALNGFGLLRRRDDVYSLRKEAERYLTSTRGSDLSAAVRMAGVLDKKLRGLTHAIRTGERDDFHAHLEDEEWSAYLRGLGSLARITAGEVAKKLKLTEPESLLDVAGGHGQFSVALCRRHPSLRSVILDLPGGAQVGRAMVAETEVKDRIEYREGDLREAPWGEGYDAVLLFNILHNLPEEDASGAVERAYAALRPGGTLAILEGQHAGGRGDLSFQEGFGELFFYVLSHSLTWPAPTLRAWMREAGFAQIRQRGLLTLPGAALLVGKRMA